MANQDSALLAYLAAGAEMAQRPWPRYRLSRDQWQDLILHLAVADWTLLALWGEPTIVYATFYDSAAAAIGVASLDCPDGHFPSLSGVRPSAIRLERAAQDLYGLTADGLTDVRPWLDHGQWRHAQSPPAGAPAAQRAANDYHFLPVEGEGIHQIPVGPVHAGIIEPGGFRFHCNGEAVVRLEQRLGYTHKGTESLMVGKLPEEAAQFAARLSGDSTVACSLAFAQAAEWATGTTVPPRAVYLRALMGELERVANHFGDIGAICNDAAFAFMLAHFSVLREEVLRIAESCFDHRLMMDRVVPGGVTQDLNPIGEARLRAFMPDARDRLSALLAVYDNKPSLLDRTFGTGIVSAALARQFGAGGYVGRASGRDIDARRDPGYPPYDELVLSVPVLPGGDVNSRLMVRAREVEASLSLIEQILDRLPGGSLRVPIGRRAGEGIGLVEGFRGDYLAWVSLTETGAVRRAHLRDPSWFQWPLLEAAIENNIVADFPLCNKSFNCSYSGHDL